MKSKIKIDHVALYVNDLESLKQFFITYFNATPHPIYENPKTGLKSYFLTFTEGARLELMWRPEIKTIKKECMMPDIPIYHSALAVKRK